MNDLVDVLDRVATRGTPRGSNVVFDEAVRALRRGGATVSLRDLGSDAGTTSIDLVEFERSTPRRWRRKTVAFAIALVSAAAALVAITDVRHPTSVDVSSPSSESAAGTSWTAAGALIEVPGLSSLITSRQSASAAEFGSVVATVLKARDGIAPDLRETATRSTEQGQDVNYVHFAGTGRRLFVISGGADLIASVPGLRDQLVAGPKVSTGQVLLWPEESWKRTIALTTSDSVIVVSSEAIDRTGSAWSIADLVDLAKSVSAPEATIFDAFKSAQPGAPGCAPASPTIGNEFRGTSDSGLLSGLIFATKPSMGVGDDVKLVVRMTGSGPLTVASIAPDGTAMSLTPNAHTGSSFNRPGDEWDTGITYTQPGCWQIHFARTDTAADAWFQVTA